MIAIWCCFLATCCGAEAACDLATAPSDRWQLVKRSGVAWLADPCGGESLSYGVNVVDGAVAPAGDTPAWLAQTHERLTRWGFNTLGGWSLPGDTLRLPAIPDLELGRISRFHWFDPFSQETERAAMDEAKRLVAPTRGSPWRIGYYFDNEVGWWSGALFAFFSAKPADSATKQRWVICLREFYHDDWRRFATDFIPPPGVGDWDSLRAAETITHLRPGGHGIVAVRRWTGLVAERYYDLMTRALRAADPGALLFGDRLPIYYDPDAIRAEARHVDAIATNYNPDSPDGWIARYYFDGLRQLTGGKPVLVSEWFFAANENRTGNRNNGHLMTVGTQVERAAGASEAVRQFAALPDLVGLHWFQYADDPKGGRADGEDYDFGLVDRLDAPYEELTAALESAQEAAPAIHRGAPRQARRPATIAIPHAPLDPDATDLRAWPKAAALLPPLVPAKGEVAFGEAYASWSDRGLQIATIGQDYYDIGLMAYDGLFPLGEAYQIALTTRIGGAERHFTLFVVPPKTKAHDHPPMSVLLCATDAGLPAFSDSCVPVPGGTASYFGADQPRITATITLPWPALTPGEHGSPASGTRLGLDLAITGWHRAKWMSLSGAPPEAAKPVGATLASGAN